MLSFPRSGCFIIATRVKATTDCHQLYYFSYRYSGLNFHIKHTFNLLAKSVVYCQPHSTYHISVLWLFLLDTFFSNVLLNFSLFRTMYGSNKMHSYEISDKKPPFNFLGIWHLFTPPYTFRMQTFLFSEDIFKCDAADWASSCINWLIRQLEI